MHRIPLTITIMECLKAVFILEGSSNVQKYKWNRLQNRAVVINFVCQANNVIITNIVNHILTNSVLYNGMHTNTEEQTNTSRASDLPHQCKQRTKTKTAQHWQGNHSSRVKWLTLPVHRQMTTRTQDINYSTRLTPPTTTTHRTRQPFTLAKRHIKMNRQEGRKLDKSQWIYYSWKK